MSPFTYDPFFTFTSIFLRKDGDLDVDIGGNWQQMKIEEFIKFAPLAIQMRQSEMDVVIAVQPTSLCILVGSNQDLSFLKQLTRLERLKLVSGDDGEMRKSIDFSFDWVPNLTHFKCGPKFQEMIDVSKFEGYLSLYYARGELECSVLDAEYVGCKDLCCPNLVSLKVGSLENQTDITPNTFPSLVFLQCKYVRVIPTSTKVLRSDWCELYKIGKIENNIEELWIDGFSKKHEPPSFESLLALFPRVERVWVNGRLVYGTGSLQSILNR